LKERGEETQTIRFEKGERGTRGSVGRGRGREGSGSGGRRKTRGHRKAGTKGASVVVTNKKSKSIKGRKTVAEQQPSFKRNVEKVDNVGGMTTPGRVKETFFESTRAFSPKETKANKERIGDTFGSLKRGG
jgi:hypothetical protein